MARHWDCCPHCVPGDSRFCNVVLPCCAVVVHVVMWEANLTWFAELTNAARLLALSQLARVQWAISCGQSGNVDPLSGIGRGVGTFGSEAGTLVGSDAHSPEIDDGLTGATLGGGAGMPGYRDRDKCVGSAAGPLKIARRLSMASYWA